MNGLRLDKRLFACAGLVRKGTALADIGTDHAYLPTYLVLNNLISTAIAGDINRLPLESAKRTVQQYGVEDRVKVVFSNGLEAIGENDFSDLVIAGMGGELISEIIDNAQYLKNQKYRLILQPMSKANLLRKYLCENGFKIECEIPVIENKKVYTVIGASFCGIPYGDELFYHVGLLENDNSQEALFYRKKVKNALLKQAEGLLLADGTSEKAKEINKLTERIKV